MILQDLRFALRVLERQPVAAVQTLWNKTSRPGNVSGGDYPDLVGELSPFAAASRYAGGKLLLETAGQAEFAGAYGVDAGFADVFRLDAADGPADYAC